MSSWRYEKITDGIYSQDQNVERISVEGFRWNERKFSEHGQIFLVFFSVNDVMIKSLHDTEVFPCCDIVRWCTFIHVVTWCNQCDTFMEINTRILWDVMIKNMKLSRFDDGWKRHHMWSNVNVEDTSFGWVFHFNRSITICEVVSHLLQKIENRVKDNPRVRTKGTIDVLVVWSSRNELKRMDRTELTLRDTRVEQR